MVTAYPQLEVVTNGRGGSIVYREDLRTVRFTWEFALPPAVALVFGPSARQWESAAPWAAGRRAEIYNWVGKELVRQKAPGSNFCVDLDASTIHITASRYADPESAAGGATNVTAPINTVAPRDPLELALHDHLSIDKRLAAAEELHSQHRLDGIDAFLAGQIRKLYRTDDGLERAMRLAVAFPTQIVKRALLWASCNATACAPRCAAVLLSLVCTEQVLLDHEVQAILLQLDRHNAADDRAAGIRTIVLAGINVARR